MKILPKYLKFKIQYKSYVRIKPTDICARIGDIDEREHFLWSWEIHESRFGNIWYSKSCYLQLSLWFALHDNSVFASSSDTVRNAILHLKSFPFSFISSCLMSIIGDESTKTDNLSENFMLGKEVILTDDIFYNLLLRTDTFDQKREFTDNIALNIQLAFSSLYSAPPFSTFCPNIFASTNFSSFTPDIFRVVSHRVSLLVTGNSTLFPIQLDSRITDVMYDVTISSEEDPCIIFSAHRAILSAASDKFVSEFKFGFNKFCFSENRILRLQSMSSVCLGCFLWYIYTGYIFNIEDYVSWFFKNVMLIDLENSDSVVDDVALNLLFVSDEYLIPKLKILCVNFLVNRVSARNAFNIYSSTSALDVPELTAAAAIIALVSMQRQYEISEEICEFDEEMCRSLLMYLGKGSG